MSDGREPGINVIDLHLIISISDIEHSVLRDLSELKHRGNLKMRWIIFLSVLALVTLSLAEEENKEVKQEEKGEDKKYTDRFDDIDIEEIVQNRRLLVPYLKCVLDKGRCTPEGKELKVHVKDAMQTACAKCTDKQKSGARRVVNHIRDNEKEYWEELVNKFDPKGEYKSTYEPFLAAKE